MLSRCCAPWQRLLRLRGQVVVVDVVLPRLPLIRLGSRVFSAVGLLGTCLLFVLVCDFALVLSLPLSSYTLIFFLVIPLLLKHSVCTHGSVILFQYPSQFIRSEKPICMSDLRCIYTLNC